MTNQADQRLFEAIEALNLNQAIAMTSNVNWADTQRDHLDGWRVSYGNVFGEIAKALSALGASQRLRKNRLMERSGFDHLVKSLVTSWMDRGYNPLLDPSFFGFVINDLKGHFEPYQNPLIPSDQKEIDADHHLAKWLIGECERRELTNKDGEGVLGSFVCEQFYQLSPKLINILIDFGCDPNEGAPPDQQQSQDTQKTSYPVLTTIFFEFEMKNRRHFSVDRNELTPQEQRVFDNIVAMAWTLIERGADPLGLDPQGGTSQQNIHHILGFERYKNVPAAQEFLAQLDAYVLARELGDEMKAPEKPERRGVRKF